MTRPLGSRLLQAPCRASKEPVEITGMSGKQGIDAKAHNGAFAVLFFDLAHCLFNGRQLTFCSVSGSGFLP